MGWGNKSLIKWSRSHDQDGAMSIYGKNLKHHLLWNQKADDLESWYAALGTRVLQVSSNNDPGMTLIYLMGRSNFVPYAFVWEKR